MFNFIKQTFGILMVISSGTISTSTLIICKLLRTWNWPPFRLMGVAACCIWLCLTIGLLFTTVTTEERICERRDVKWVILRGAAGSSQFIFALLAAAHGAGVGDIGALGSINTVVAALLGRLVLGERLEKLHIMSIMFSVLGACLISDPEEIARSDGHSSSFPWIGYLLALLAGTSFGCMFICARKSGSASALLLTTSAMGQRGLLCLILTQLGAIDDNDLSQIQSSPSWAVGWVMLLVVTTFTGNVTANMGSKMCPAAVTSTVMTAVNMGAGYAAQVIIFDKPPKPITLAGAGMMLVAVVTMALARLPPRSMKTNSVQSPEEQSLERETSTGSFASFVASEFAERMPQPPEEVLPTKAPASEESVRRRTVGGSLDGTHEDVQPAPVTIGAIAPSS